MRGNEKSPLAADDLGRTRETSAGRSDGGDLVLLNDDVDVGQTNSPPDIDHSYIHNRNRFTGLIVGCTSSQHEGHQQDCAPALDHQLNVAWSRNCALLTSHTYVESNTYRPLALNAGAHKGNPLIAPGIQPIGEVLT
jgi:hypothetical protein